MFIQEYVLVGKFTVLPQHFVLAQLWIAHAILITEINKRERKIEKICFLLIGRPCHSMLFNRGHIEIASTEAKSQLVSNKRTSV